MSPGWALAMLSPGDIAKIRADIKRLEKARAHAGAFV
jgi:hypothetical protein